MKFLNSAIHKIFKIRYMKIILLFWFCVFLIFSSANSYGQEVFNLNNKSSIENRQFFLPLKLDALFPKDMTSKKAAKRMMPIKPIHTKIEKEIQHKDSIIVKFAEGTEIRLRRGKLVSLKPTDRVKTRRQMLMLKRILTKHKVKKIERLFSSPERELDWMKDKEVRYV